MVRPDLTSRLPKSRFFLDLEIEHDGCSMGKRREGSVLAWLLGAE